MNINIPTMLTWLRILLIPIFVGAFYWPENLRTLDVYKRQFEWSWNLLLYVEET